MELHETLAALRKEKGLSQFDVAEKLNVSRQAVSRWEVGASVPTMENLIALSELYELPLETLLYGIGSDGRGAAPKGHKTGAVRNWCGRFLRGKNLLIAVLLLVIIGLGSVIALQARQNTNRPTEIERLNIEDMEREKITFPIEEAPLS